MIEGVDVSYAQGNYWPGNEEFVIINASRANVGLAVGSQYRNQVANARAVGKHVGHYFFNGNVDPVICANFFVDNLVYQSGDSLWLDVESEPSTGTPAWNPDQALAFIKQVRSRLGVTPGVYINRSLMDGMDWSAVVAAGAALWIAYYQGSPPPIRWWPTWDVWQYTSTPIDRNRAQATSLASLGATPIDTSPKVEDDAMPIFHNTDRTILWANGFYSSYDQGVYNSLHYYFVDNPGVELPGTEGTAVREIWHATDFMTQRTATAAANAVASVVGQLGVGNGAGVDQAAITAAVVAALPKSYTVTAGPAA